MFEGVDRKVRDVNRLLLAVSGAAAAGMAAVALGAGSVHADPSGNSTLNVVGEPYAKAVAILRAQGVKASFGGSVGSDVPQAQCIVKSEKVLASHKVQLELDCSAAAQPQPQQPAAPAPATSGAATSGAATSGAPATETARPTPGAPGVVTVIPKPVG